MNNQEGQEQLGTREGMSGQNLQPKTSQHGRKSPCNEERALLPANPSRMRVKAHQHDWSDSGSESPERHFLGSHSRVRQELHELAQYVDEQQVSDFRYDADFDDASLEVEAFSMKGTGIENTGVNRWNCLA